MRSAARAWEAGIGGEFGRDAGERLKNLLSEHQVPYLERLIRPANMAGKQLEWLKPHMATTRNQQIISRPVVGVPRGTIITVLADSHKVLVLYLLPLDNRRQAITYLVQEFLENHENHHKGERWTGKSSINVAIEALTRYGRPPRRHHVVLKDEIATGLSVGLWAAFAETTIGELVDHLEKLIDRNICPALVGLVGQPARVNGKLLTTAAWPIVLPLASYADNLR